MKKIIERIRLKIIANHFYNLIDMSTEGTKFIVWDRKGNKYFLKFEKDKR